AVPAVQPETSGPISAVKTENPGTVAPVETEVSETSNSLPAQDNATHDIDAATTSQQEVTTNTNAETEKDSSTQFSQASSAAGAESVTLLPEPNDTQSGKPSSDSEQTSSSKVSENFVTSTTDSVLLLIAKR